MTKAERAMILRARFIAKYGMKHWVPAPAKKRPPPEKARRPRTYDQFGVPFYRYGPTCEWILTPDPRPKIDLNLKRADDQPSAVTRIAMGMAAYNRTPWAKRPRDEKPIKPTVIKLRRKGTML